MKWLTKWFKKLFGIKEKKPDAPVWNKASQVFDVRDCSWVSFRTRGIKHQDEENDVGHEYIISQLTGVGFNRVLFCHMSGTGRSIRLIVEREDGSDSKYYNLITDNQPEDHEWKQSWDGMNMCLWYDGGKICTVQLVGKPVRITVGGNGDARRNMVGEWREFQCG